MILCTCTRCYTWNMNVKHEIDKNINFYGSFYDTKHETLKIQHMK